MPDPNLTAGIDYDAEDEYHPEPPPPPLAPAWQDGSYRVGIHTSIAGDLAGSLDIAKKLGCNALQIFTGSPRMWPRPGARIPDAEAARFRARREELGLGPVVVHTNYLINLAASSPLVRVRTVQAFRGELLRGAAIGADFLVVHPGSARGASVEAGIVSVVASIRQAMVGVKLGGLRVLLENTSGMGSALGARFEELATMLAGLRDLNVGVCLDTAHTLEAGYEIRTPAGLDQTLETLHRTVGLEQVAVVHVNDSKTPLGSRVDRHEHIGKGKIGLDAFRRILNHPLLAPTGQNGLPGRAFILETPIDKPGDDRRNVRAVWNLLGIPVKQAPRAEDGFSMLKRKIEKGKKKRGTTRRASATKRRRR